MKGSRKWLLSLLLAAAMVVALPPTAAFATNGTWAGSGTEGDPYQIADAADLAALAASVNGGDSQSGKYFVLTGDITLSSAWTPIGDDSKPFQGYFDGAGFSVNIANGSDVRISPNSLYYGYSVGFAGLFGFVGSAAVIENLGVRGSFRVDCFSIDAGGVAGYSEGTIRNCFNACSVNVGLSSYYVDVGGIVGHAGAPSVIQNSFNAGSVFGPGGLNEDHKMWIGGVAGLNHGAISNCYNVGPLAADAPTLSLFGGITCFDSGKNSHNYYLSGGGDAVGTELTQAYMQSGAFVKLLNGWICDQPLASAADYRLWTIMSGENNGYPVFSHTPGVYTITAGATGNGSISPSGATSVVETDDLEFNFTPDSGYGLFSVTVDQTPVSPTNNTYIIENITADHTIEATFKRLISICTIEGIPWQQYTGSPVEPALTITDGAYTLVPGTDYTVAYSNNTDIGIATATITGTDSYMGTVAVSFVISTGEYYITFLANGGSGSMEAQHGYLGIAMALSANTFTRDGYIFDGWNTSPDGSGSAYTDGQSVSFDGDTDLYAQWTGYVNTVTFDKNGGDTDASPSSIDVAYGGTTPLPPTNPARAGYTFGGWNTKADGSGTGFTSSTPVYRDITVYAVWYENLTGLGTEESPYLIGTASQLRSMAFFVNSDIANYGDKYYLMTADIDLGAKWTETDGGADATLVSGLAWTTIAANVNLDGYYPGFTGVFDGGGHTVSGLYINNSLPTQGLFGYVRGATIRNVGVVDSYIRGGTPIGGVVGAASYSSAGHGTKILNCFSTATVVGRFGQCGGIAGYLLGYGSMEGCYNGGRVMSLNFPTAGGLAGGIGAGALVKNCYNEGTISGRTYVGGLAGSISGGTLTDCYNAGAVIANDSPAGAIAGAVYLGVAYGDTKTADCFFLEGTSASAVGGVSGSGSTYSEDITQVTAEELSGCSVCYFLQEGESSLVWGQDAIGGTNFPKLAYWDSAAKKAVRVRFYDDSSTPGTYALNSTAYTLSGCALAGGDAAFPALTGVTWLDGSNNAYTGSSTFGADTDLYSSRADRAPVILTAALPNGRVGEPYSATLSASGGTPITWYELGLPDGLMLSGNVVSGTPRVAGAYGVAFLAKNSVGTSALKTYSLTISPSASIASTVPTSLTEAPANDGSLASGTVVITIANGTLADPLLKADVAASNLPTGLDYSLARDSATQLTVTITGKATSHANANDVSDLTFTIARAKVDGATADLTTAPIRIDFNDPEGPAPVDATLSPSTGSFDKNPANQADVTATIAWGNATRVTDVKAGGATIGAGNYTVSGDTLTIKKEFLAAQPTGSLALTVEFDQGAPATLTITISDTTPPPVAVTNITVTAAGGVSSLQVGNTLQMLADVLPADATDKSVTWSIASGSGASIDSSGLLRATAVGSVTVRATANDGSGVYGEKVMTVTSGTGGGGSSVSTPTYTATVSGADISMTALPVVIDADAGSATVNLGTTLAEDIFAGAGTAVLTMPDVSGLSSYTVTLPASVLSDPQGEGALTLATGAGSVIIPSGMLAGTPGSEGQEAGITIGRGDKSRLPDEIRTAIGDRPVIELALTLGETRVEWNNPDAPVTVSIPYTPTAAELENPESIVIWYIDGGGNVVCVPNGRYDPATGTVTFTTGHFSCYAVSFRPVSFKDVARDAWYEKAVSFIAARGITTGTGGGDFSPEATLTRGQFIVMLMKAYGIAPDANPQDNFADAGQTYYTGYLAAAKRLGISAGVGGNLFAPEKEITRQEMFTLLYNALGAIGKLPRGSSGSTLSSFSDAGDIAPWAVDAVRLLVETGTVSGSGNRLSPKDTATRAQMAQVLYSLLLK